MGRTVCRTFRILALAVAAAQFPAFAGTLEGRVVGVSDGDTITVLDSDKRQHKVRLTGIDAPEKSQPFGEASKKNLSRLVYLKDVRVESHKQDRYGRTLGKVWVRPSDCTKCGLTLDANLAQLTVGMAWWYRKYASEQPAADRGQYEFAEQEAKARKAGLWREPNPMPPWDWRHGGASAASSAPAPGSNSCVIKGNINGKGHRIYHAPGQRYYRQTQISVAKGERWFCSEEQAKSAGWRRSRS
jgi:endonuclease YncB( thermonuclease family)